MEMRSGKAGAERASRYVQLAKYLKGQSADNVALGFGEVERLLGSPLPASARRLRTWWTNDVTHTQARNGWLAAGWMVEAVDFEAGVVKFRRTGEPLIPTAARGVGGDAGARGLALAERAFVALAAEALSRRLGVELHIGVRVKARLREGGELTRVFDLATADGRILGEAMYLSAGKAPAARFPAISEHVWILEKVEAEEKFVAFGGDPLVPKLWIERYGRLVRGVRFYHVGADGKVEALN